jgi:hypothetical protein
MPAPPSRHMHSPSPHLTRFGMLSLLCGLCFQLFDCFWDSVNKYWTRTPRRFPPPWSIEDTGACFVVKDSGGFIGTVSSGGWPLAPTRIISPSTIAMSSRNCSFDCASGRHNRA